MMLWNNSEFDELGELVTTPYANIVSRKRSTVKSAQRPARFKVVLGVAALFASFTIGTAHANSYKTTLPLSELVISQSVAEEPPPLENLFVGRFEENWTAEDEASLLSKAEQERRNYSKDTLILQIVDTIFSNQQEDLSLQVPRLDMETVAGIVRKKQLVR